MQQALERAGIKNNLGWNYALQAIEMGSLFKNLNQLKKKLIISVIAPLFEIK